MNAPPCVCKRLCEYCGVELQYELRIHILRFPKCTETKICENCGCLYNKSITQFEFQDVRIKCKCCNVKIKKVQTAHLTHCLYFDTCCVCHIPENSVVHSKGCVGGISKLFRRLWYLWEMEISTYTSYVQWLPREMVEDILLLSKKIMFRKFFSRYHDMGLSLTYLNATYTQEDAFILPRTNPPLRVDQ